MEIKNLVEDFIGFVRQYKLMRKLFGFIYHKLHRDPNVNLIEDLKENFQKNGLIVLQTFDEVMEECGIKYSLAFGTMLGAVREKGFIKHDADIDVYVWIEDYSPVLLSTLQKYGFELFHAFTVDSGKSGKEDTVMLKGVQIDIFYIYPALEGRKYPYCCDFIVHPDCLTREHSMRKHGGLLPRRLEIPVTKEVIRVPFESLHLPILKNAHEYLSFRYGPDYMTPNPGWSSGKNPNIIPWNDKIAIFM